MFGVVLLVVYAPTMITAINERKEKMKAAKRPQEPDVADQIPEHIQQVHPQPQQLSRPTAEPMPIPAVPIQKKKDSKKRSTKGYKGNKNAS